MANLGLTVKGGGHYDEDQWNSNIIDSKVIYDWWISLDSWHSLISTLSKVQTDVVSSRRAIADLIDGVKKDLPAALDRRFAGSQGVLGAANYRAPPLFVRLDSAMRANLIAIARMGDQPFLSRDQELSRNRPNTGTNQQPSNALVARDVQPLRDSALHFTYDLKDLVTSDPPVFDRRSFEAKFQLNWVARAPGDNA
ncbi:beta-A protein [Lychnis ringspot virus]|uniref:Beta-A protein n=1 Tax=Lychnis ringspot virus TaxID=44421 RepID=Q83076_9VIRU|nr:beta-A protein [Lychnis ringspot virus]CAA86469.1 beta-A protein [Lychnis ringspot virus]